MALSLAAATAALARSPQRLVFVVAAPDDPRAARQSALLERESAALRERDVVVRRVTPEAARNELGVSSSVAFEVLLVGKDGEVKLRRDAPVAASEITALIDTMPMRREEMRRRKGGAANP